MSGALRAWLLRLVTAALVLSVAEAVTPEGLPKKVQRLTGGLLVLLVLVQPVLSLVSGTDSLTLSGSWLERYSQESELTDAGDTLLESIITENSQAYIEEQGQSLGAEVQAEVTCTLQDDLPVPSAVTVTGSLSEEQRDALTAEIQESFGISAEDQSYREAQE